MDLDKLKAFFESEEGLKSLEVFADKMKAERRRIDRANEYIQRMKKPIFDERLKEEIAKHNDEWTDRCYSKGVMPYPTNLIELLFDAAQTYGKPFKGVLDDFDSDWCGSSVKYRGYYFNWINGQGTVIRIFNENKEEIFSIG
jgi:hypothetical protein